MADKQTLQQKIQELQEEYSKTKHNKATNKHLGIVRAKIAKLRREIGEKKGKKGIGFSVRKSGNATVVLVGFPNAGKSSLLKCLTDAESKVADYAFTTLDVIPGMLEYNGANIQVLDIPGLIEGAHIGKGAGIQIASVIRIAELLLIVADATAPEQASKLINELSLLGIKVNKEKPKIVVEERNSGGISVEANEHKVPSRADVSAVLNETGIYNCKVIFYSDMNFDDLVALLLDNSVYTKGVVALNKIDLLERGKVEQLRSDMQSRLGMPVVAVSAAKETNIEELRATLFDSLGLVRVYLKPKDGNADFSKPLALKRGSAILDVAKGLHSKAAKNLKCAYVTGKSAKFSNQKVGIEHVINDGDIVTLIYEKF